MENKNPADQDSMTPTPSQAVVTPTPKGIVNSASQANATPQPDSPRSMFLSAQEVVTIQVKGDVQFTVHKELLIMESAYFDRALNGLFLESQTQKILLDDINATSLGVYVHALYRSYFVRDAQFFAGCDHTGGRLNLWGCITLWSLADRFMNGRLLEIARRGVQTALGDLTIPFWESRYVKKGLEFVKAKAAKLQEDYVFSREVGVPCSEDIAKCLANVPPEIFPDVFKNLKDAFAEQVLQAFCVRFAAVATEHNPHPVRKRKRVADD